MLLLTAVAFLSGIVTILSPCILPVLPIVLSGSTGGKWRPYGIITGFILSFTLFTLTLTELVTRLNIAPDSLKIAAVVLILLFGAVLLVPPIQRFYERTTSFIPGLRKGTKNRQGFSGGILTGVSLGLIWTPCVGPIMASVISLSITNQADSSAFFITAAYSLGTAIPMTAIMLGGRKLLEKIPGAIKNSSKIQRVFGVVLILTGLSIAFGWDRDFQNAVLNTFPSYGKNLTVLEQSKTVEDALKKQFNDDSTNEERKKAPPLVTNGMWFNSSPLTMEELKGKVVIIDFWTYSCINCVRTIPYLQSWYETYKDDGLVIIGVHSPEFAFERDPDNLAKAIKDLGVTWPVVQDNSFLQWQAYNNRYWPAKYFIDAEGFIRYTHFGEGDYEESEQIIRMLLAEKGSLTAEEKAPMQEEDKNEALTPETYLGYGRSEGFTTPDEVMENQYKIYRKEILKKSGEWTVEGEWAVTKEYIVNGSAGALSLNFQAKDVFLVIEPVDEQVELNIRIDGKIPPDTKDVIKGVIRPSESRHYQLIGLEEGEKHILNIKVNGKARFFAFTFG